MDETIFEVEGDLNIYTNLPPSSSTTYQARTSSQPSASSQPGTSHPAGSNNSEFGAFRRFNLPG